MRITLEADYALRIILFLVKFDKEVRLEAKEISDKTCVSLRFTLKIMRKLTAACVTNSYRGVGGGYSLKKDSSQINVKEIIEIIDGPIAINKCMEDEGECSMLGDERCKIHKGLSRAQELLEGELKKLTFDKF